MVISFLKSLHCNQNHTDWVRTPGNRVLLGRGWKSELAWCDLTMDRERSDRIAFCLKSTRSFWLTFKTDNRSKIRPFAVGCRYHYVCTTVYSVPFDRCVILNNGPVPNLDDPRRKTKRKNKNELDVEHEGILHVKPTQSVVYNLSNICTPWLKFYPCMLTYISQRSLFFLSCQ